MAKEGNNFTYKEDIMVTLPAAHTSFAIGKREWIRLKDTVNSCSTDSQWFMSFAFCFFGIAGSAFITWISLLSQQGIDFIQFALVITSIVSVVLGILCLLFQKKLNKKQAFSIDMIKREIKFIEEGIPSDAS